MTTAAKVFEMLADIIDGIRDLNSLPRRRAKPTDTPFDGESGLDSLNALEAEALLAEQLGIPSDSEILSALRDPTLPLGEVARRIADKLPAKATV